MEKNLEKVEILDLTKEGNGVARLNSGAVIFIPDVLPGDRALVQIKEKKKNFLIGEKVKLIEGSKNRREAFCTHAKTCSGCVMQDYNYTSQLEIKKRLVEQNLKKIAQEDRKLEIIESKSEKGYRNKITLKVSKEGKLGYYKRNSHENLSINDCPIASEKIRMAIKDVQKAITKLYETTKEEPLNEIIIKEGKEGIMIIYSVKKNSHGLKTFAQDLIKLPKLKSLYQKETIKRGKAIKENYKKIYGQNKLLASIGNYDFYISPQSFFQINKYATKDLYEKACEYLKGLSSKKLLDLYSGIGTTTTYFSKYTQNAVGVEIIQEAVKDADKNAEINNIQNTRFYCLNADDGLLELIIKEKPDTITVDPPRAGLSKTLIENIITSAAKNVVYISCDPATLCRDIKLFKDGGFKLKKISLVDMFPETMHVETIALIQKI